MGIAAFSRSFIKRSNTVHVLVRTGRICGVKRLQLMKMVKSGASVIVSGGPGF